jgi:ribosomal protein L6P/L9E
VTKNFRHAAVEIDKLKQNTPKRKGDYIRIRKWFGRAGDAAAAGTLRGIIKGMIVGVTEVSHSSHTVASDRLFFSPMLN